MQIKFILISAIVSSLHGFGAETVSTSTGKSSFTAKTNISAVTVQGKSNQLTVKCSVSRQGDVLELNDIEAQVPVTSLSTGMGVRDRHMQERIFKSSDGKMPDLRFASSHSECSRNGNDFTCRITGEFTLRGVARPVDIAVKVHDQDGAYRAQGDALLKLSAFGIQPPAELGVQVRDIVEFHVDFTANTRVDIAERR